MNRQSVICPDCGWSVFRAYTHSIPLSKTLHRQETLWIVCDRKECGRRFHMKGCFPFSYESEEFSESYDKILEEAEIATIAEEERRARLKVTFLDAQEDADE